MGNMVQRGRSLGTLEGLKFVGPIPSPVSGIIRSTNPLAGRDPRLLSNSPYEQGWIVKVLPYALDGERHFLSTAGSAAKVLGEKIVTYRARCFKAFPDHEMVEIGTECSGVLAKLNELLATISDGDAVHLVSDDPTAYVEMVRWTEQTGNSLVEWRTEGSLFHFIVRKTR